MSTEKLGVEIMSQGRFSLRIPNADAPRDSAIRVIDDAENGQRTALTVRDARELRDLLLHEFPLEPNGSVNREHIFEHETPEPHDETYKCRSCQRWFRLNTTSPCPGPPEPSPAVAAAAEPDPDEVRRAWMANPQFRTLRERELVDAAIAAWLRLREQQPCCRGFEPCGHGFESPTTGRWLCELPRDHKGPHSAPSVNRIEGCKDCAALIKQQQPAEPAPTIAQVIEACGAVGDWQLVVTPSLSGRPVARVDQWDASAGDWTKLATSGPCDTPEAAIRALFDDAVAKLEQQRDEAAAKLQKLGRS